MSKTTRSITATEEQTIRANIDNEILPKLEAMRKALGPVRSLTALQIIRGATAYMKAQLTLQGFQKEEAALVTETFGRMMVFSAGEIRNLLKNRETTRPKGN